MSDIEFLTNYYYKNFGLKKQFQEKESELFVYKGKILFCQGESSLKEDDYHYKFNLQIVDEIYSDYDIKKTKLCKYCNLCHCQFRLKCCNSPIHSECALENHFKCNCGNDKNLKPKQNLLELDNKCNDNKCNEINSIDNTCVVCFEKCNTKTSCGHILCNTCLAGMHKEQGNDLNCPYCREALIQSKKPEIKEVKINNKVIIKVKIIYI